MAREDLSDRSCEKNYYKQSKRRGASYMQQNEGRLTGFATLAKELTSRTRY